MTARTATGMASAAILAALPLMGIAGLMRDSADMIERHTFAGCDLDWSRERELAARLRAMADRIDSGQKDNI